jgi:hypothetical protein
MTITEPTAGRHRTERTGEHVLDLTSHHGPPTGPNRIVRPPTRHHLGERPETEVPAMRIDGIGLHPDPVSLSLLDRLFGTRGRTS